MLEPKAPYCSTVVIAHLLLLHVEAHTLADDLLRLVVRAPSGKGAFETNDEDAFGLELASSGAKCMAFAGGLVEGYGALQLRRDVASHIKSLHGRSILPEGERESDGSLLELDESE
jgi:hypothetical protein